MECGQAGFFSDPPLAHNSCFTLPSLSPLFARNTQKITPVLQASKQEVKTVVLYGGETTFDNFKTQ